MGNVLINSNTMYEVADSVRVLKGSSDTYLPSEMAAEILDVIPDVEVEGNPIHITDAAAYPAVSCVTTLEPVQEGSGDPSPENVRPISGHTGVGLTRTGKNLFDGYVEQGTISTLTGQEQDSNNRLRTRYIKVLPNTTYSISTNLKIRTVCEYANNYIFLTTLIDSGVGQSTFKITTSANATYIRFVMMVTSSASVTPDDFEWGQLELGSTATEYEPYTPETHSQTFPQAQSPVYGCEVDWTEGVLRVTDVNVDLGTLTWGLTSRGYFVAAITDIKRASSDTELANIKCSVYKTDTSNNIYYNRTDKAICVSVNANDIWIIDSNYSSAAEFKTAMSGVQLVYELATPLEIDLTPEVITLLKGENNVWTDSGTSEIEYKVDLNSYIQKLIDEASAQESLSMSPLSLGKSAAEPTDGEDAREIEEVDEPVTFDGIKESEEGK